jgi:hypothetical protein
MGEPGQPVVHFFCITLLLGNPSDPTEAILMEDPANPVGKDSKTVYINDSYNLDMIPLDVNQIIDTNETVDID